MAFVQGILAAILRSLGKILNTAFGWATILLFGRVPARKQALLSAASLGSVAWLVAVIGIASPRFAAFVLAFVTLPDWVHDNWIRLAMLGVAVLIPPVLGVLSIFMLDEEDRPRGFFQKLGAVLRGYPYALGLSATLVQMILLAPIMKAQDLARRWIARHVPIVVSPEHYFSVLSDLEAALQEGGFETRRAKATWMLRAPTWLLTTLAGRAIGRFVASELTALRGEGFEVLLHPSDLILRGREKTVARVRAVLAERLTFTDAFFTYEKDAQKIEERLAKVWERLLDGGAFGSLDRAALEGLRKVERDLERIEVPYEEWEVLFREKLQVERLLLGTALGLPGYRPLTAIERLAREAA